MTHERKKILLQDAYDQILEATEAMDEVLNAKEKIIRSQARMLSVAIRELKSTFEQIELD